MNRKSSIVLALAAVVVISASIVFRSSGLCAIASEKEAPAKASFLDRLKLGESVDVEERNGRYYFTLLPQNIRPLKHTIIDVGSDYVTVRDLVGITDTIIPIYSVASIKVLRIGDKPGG